MSGSDGRPSPALNQFPIVAPPHCPLGGHMSSNVIGLIFIAGGLSGTLALVGTNSGITLAVVGLLPVGRGIYPVRKQRTQPPAQYAARRTQDLCVRSMLRPYVLTP